jgi:molybdate transport system permease protein
MAAPAVLLVAFLGLPVAALLARAVVDGEVVGVAMRGSVPAALGLSLATTSLSVVATIALGLPLALLLARGQFRGKDLVTAVIDLPMVLPPTVAGLALLLALGRASPIGRFLADTGVVLPFTTAAVVFAQVFVAGPFFVRAARAGLTLVEGELEDAARVDGASEVGVLRFISLPLAAPAMAAGLVMTWARALGEFGATIMFAGNVAGVTQTLPLAVYGEFQSSLEAAIAAAAILVLAALGVLLAVRVLGWRPMLDLRQAG